MAYFREMLDVDFHERVAREHVDGGMPLGELRRNHDVPLAAVKAWVALYTAGGRPALAAAADALAAAQRKTATPATLRKLREVLAAPVSDGRSREARRAAVIAVGARRFGELADAVEELVARGEE